MDYPDDEDNSSGRWLRATEEAIEILNKLMESKSSMPPVAPDGGFAPALLGEAESIPEATEVNFVCLRGPCRHYMQYMTWFPAGNTEGTFSQITRYCCKLPTKHIDLTEELVRDCNQWDPYVELERQQLEDHRQAYLAKKKG